MGQHWKLVNIDKRRELFNHEKLELSGHCQLQLREFLLSTIAEQLVSLLRISKLRPFKVSEDQIHTAKVKSVSSPLIALPQEIIDLVVSVLVSSGSDVDVVCLSLTCSYFFRLLASTNQTIVARNDAPWAGDRLILVGDFAEGIPPGIATDDELQEWKKFGENPFYNLAEAQVGERLPSEMPHWIRKGMVEQAHMLPSFIYQRLAGNGQNLCDRLMRMLYVWDWPPADEVEPGSDSAILRNLTTKEYVRDEIIENSEFAYSLGEVLATFIQWTEEPSGTQGLGCRGIWAGHRFDIATVGDITEEWTDLSEKALKNLIKGTDRPKKFGRREW